MPSSALHHHRQRRRRGALRPLSVAVLALAGILSAPSQLIAHTVTVGPEPAVNTAPEHANSVPEPKIASEVVHLPVVEGNGLRFSRISTEDGLSQTRVAQIVQDDEGFIWFGTQYGLNRYDGYEFKLFVHDPKRANSLAGAFISSLFKDRSGTLWIGCNQILDRFDPRTETFTHYRIESGDRENLGGTVVHISQDRSGMLWLATGTGLHRLDPNTGIITHLHHSPDNPGGLSTNDVKWTGEDRSGRLWVGTSEGLDEFDRATGTVKFHIPLADPTQISFFEDRFGLFWITYASGNGLALFDRQSNTLTRYSFYEQEPPATGLTGVMGVLEDRSGNLWLGSPGIGLLQFDRNRRNFIHYRNHPSDLESIAEDKVIALFEDREGNIWTGLHSRGPNHFSRTAAQFEMFRREPDSPNGLSVDFVNALYEDRDGALWIGNDDALNRIDRSSRQRSWWTGGLGDKPMVITITADVHGLIWFGTFGYGLNRFNPGTGRFKSYLHDAADPRSLSNDMVHRLFVDHAGTLWVGTDDGLNRFDPDTDNFTVYKLDAESRRSQSYVAIAEDASGKLWLGTHYSGLHRFDPATGEFVVFKSMPGDSSSLRDNMVPTVHVDRTGSIWVGTQNGLNKLEPTTGKFSAYDVHDGLPGNTVSCILEDDRGALWISTNKGLSRFDPAASTFVNYSAVDGLPGNDLTGWSACFKSPSGELFFGGFPGAVAFYPQKLRDNPFQPPVVLTDFHLAGVSVPIGAGSPLKESITYTDHVTLSSQQNIFSIAFAELGYVSPQTNRYRYQLEGLDKGWNEVSSDRRRAAYTTLPAGTYTFRVQAASSRGPWSTPGASLRIDILPPWWHTWWFRVLCLAAALLAMWWTYHLRVRQISHQLTIRMEERLSERTRIAQDLHDTLLQGLLSASLQLAVANKQLEADAPAKPLVSRVLDVLRQMIDEGRNAVRGLRTREPDDLERAFAQIRHDLGVDDSIKFRLVVEGTQRTLRPLIRNEVYCIGREALANAFRHSDASIIETVLEYAPDRFRMVIRDDGVGIDPEILRSGRDDHWGLSGMRERATRIDARLKVLSAPAAGTEVELIVPARGAFEPSTTRGSREWLARLYSRSEKE